MFSHSDSQVAFRTSQQWWRLEKNGPTYGPGGGKRDADTSSVNPQPPLLRCSSETSALLLLSKKQQLLETAENLEPCQRERER